MTYTWGHVPNGITSETPVSTDYTYAKGEIGRLKDAHWEFTVPNMIYVPTEEDFANILKQKLTAAGASQVLSMKVTRTAWGNPILDIFTTTYHYYLEDCYFEADPVSIPHIITLIAGIAFLIFVIAMVAVGVWLLVKVEQAAEQLGPAATIGIGIVLIIIVIGALLLLMGVRVGGKGKKGSFKIGK